MNTGVSMFYCFSERLPDFEAEMVNNFVNLYSGHTGPFLVRVRSSIALDLLAPRLNARQTAEIKPFTALHSRWQTVAHCLMRDRHRRQILDRVRHHRNDDASAVKTRIMTFGSIASRPSCQVATQRILV